MTLESVRAFIARMKTDEVFANEIKNVNAQERKEIIINAGFNFTDEELKQVREEISDEELALITGGIWNPEPKGPHSDGCVKWMAGPADCRYDIP